MSNNRIARIIFRNDDLESKSDSDLNDVTESKGKAELIKKLSGIEVTPRARQRTQSDGDLHANFSMHNKSNSIMTTLRKY